MVTGVPGMKVLLLDAETVLLSKDDVVLDSCFCLYFNDDDDDDQFEI
jgi:hypothetical protein